jgi:hypothetical protein
MQARNGKITVKSLSSGAAANVLYLLFYAAVGWIVISLFRTIIGDPLTNYLDASHNNTLIAFSFFISISFHVVVGFSVLRLLKGVTEENPEIVHRTRRLYEYNPHWDEDIAHCKEIMRNGSKSFFLASLLLPDWMRGASLALYSFCRQADDEVDEVADPVCTGWRQSFASSCDVFRVLVPLICISSDLIHNFQVGEAAGAEDRLAKLEARLRDAYAGHPAAVCGIPSLPC